MNVELVLPILLLYITEPIKAINVRTSQAPRESMNPPTSGLRLQKLLPRTGERLVPNGTRSIGHISLGTGNTNSPPPNDRRVPQKVRMHGSNRLCTRLLDAGTSPDLRFSGKYQVSCTSTRGSAKPFGVVCWTAAKRAH